MTHKLREMDVPGWGKRWVSAVYMPNEKLPSADDFSGKFLVTKDGTAYQVPWEEDSDKWYMEELERLRERAPA